MPKPRAKVRKRSACHSRISSRQPRRFRSGSRRGILDQLKVLANQRDVLYQSLLKV